jgi:DNA-binding MarR family transcriptional regulator
MSDYLNFRSALQNFTRQFDGNGSIKTPCDVSISPTKAHAIMKIGSPTNDEKLSQKDLALSLGLNKSNITRLVQALERDDFLKRAVSEADKRLFLLSLTVKGKNLCKRLEASSQSYIEELLANIPKSKHKNLIKTLEELNRVNLQIIKNRGKK